MEMNSQQIASNHAVQMDQASLDFGGGAGVFDLNFSLPRGSILGMVGWIVEHGTVWRRGWQWGMARPGANWVAALRACSPGDTLPIS
jgi:hypothetical protein